MPAMSSERIEVPRIIPADPATIFAVLASPQGHVDIDSSGMLMDATGDPVTAVGDTFVVHMDRESLNDYPLGLYDVTVQIVTFEQDREIEGASMQALAFQPGMAPHFHRARGIGGEFRGTPEGDGKPAAQAFGCDFLIISGQHGRVEPGQRLHDERRVLD